MGDAGTLLYQDLASRIDAFVAEWERGPDPPSLRSFLPDGPPEFRRLALVELVKLDLEIRLADGRTRKSVEDYLADDPELASETGTLLDLLYEEFHSRRRQGEEVAVGEYAARFPRLALGIAERLGTDECYVRTVLVERAGRRRIDPSEPIDDFDLLTELGRGSFATVFLARQRSLGRLVALKVSDRRGDEPRMLAQLDHPHVVRVYDQRELPDRELRLLYMEFVPGGTLQGVIERVAARPAEARRGADLFQVVDEALRRCGLEPPAASPTRSRLAEGPWPEVVARVGSRIAAGLAHAHRQGVLHRDLKPANVLLSAEGHPKIVDFNISFDAKLAGSSPAKYFGGSLVYMSPEQFEAADPAHSRTPGDLDEKSDLYSLGVLLWELLTGTRPFPDPTLERRWDEVLASEAARRRNGVPDEAVARLPAGTPEAVREVLLHLLEPDPARRPASAVEVARRLDLGRHTGAAWAVRPRAGRSAFLTRHSGPFVLALGVLPNVPAAVFNFVYNRRYIVEGLEGALEPFYRIQAIVNGIAFPLGILGAILLVRPVARAVRVALPDLDRGYRAAHPAALARREEDAWPQATLTTSNAASGGGGLPRTPETRRGGPLGPPPPAGSNIRVRCLELGHRYALLSVALWLVAGIAYPVAFQAAIGHVPRYAAAHFFTSLALCGLIASAYPFFLVSAYSLRHVFPALLQGEPGSSADRQALLRLGSRTTFHLVSATSVPLLSLLLMVLFDAGGRAALAVLGAGGLVGLGVAFWLAQVIQRLRRVFLHLLLPLDEALADESPLG